MKRILFAILFISAVGLAGTAYIRARDTAETSVTTARLSRGAITDAVAATGTLQAVKTVQVGTQVSGTIAWLGADFNSIVHKDQVIAKLDPSLLQAQLEQAQASVTRASAEAENARVQVANAERNYGRAKELADQQLIAQSELEAAMLAVQTAQAQSKSVEAQLVQAQAALNQNRVNLQHTVIMAPIDGIVIQRSVDVGQTVASSLQSPTIFAIAADLADMQVSASIDESEIGKIRPGQPVTFSVDAYANDVFEGTVTQVRLQPSVVQNVTTYSVIIDVPNPGLKLKPGMTANVSIAIAARQDVLRVPNAALRFQPSAETFAAIAQTVSPDNAEQRPARRALATENAQTVRESSAAAAVAESTPTATTVDALFAPVAVAETDGRVWLHTNNQLQPVQVRLGITDGQTTEIVSGDGLQPGTEVVTNISTGAEPTRTSTATGGLFMPQGGPGFGGGPGRQGGPPVSR